MYYLRRLLRNTILAPKAPASVGSDSVPLACSRVLEHDNNSQQAPGLLLRALCFLDSSSDLQFFCGALVSMKWMSQKKHLVGEFVLIWSTHANKKIVRGLLMTHQIWLHLKPELGFSCPRWMFWDFFTPWIQRWTQQLSVHAPCYFLSHTPLISFWRPLPFFHAWLAAAFVQWQRSSSVKGELVLLGPCGWSVSGHFCAGRGFLQPTPPSDVHSTLEQHVLFIKKKKKRKNGGCQLQHLLMNQCGIFLPPLGFTCSSSNSLALLFMYEYSLPERLSHTVRDQQWMLNHWFDSGPFTFNGS